jgi:hypothetical protein
MGENNTPLVGYYANKYGILLVAHLGQSAGRPMWGTTSNLRGVLRHIYLFAKSPFLIDEYY